MLFENITYLDENFHWQKGGYILTEGDKITGIRQTAPPDYQGERLSGAGSFLVPGFVDAHCHVPMTLLRGYGEGLPLDRWLTERVFPFEATLTDEEVYWGSLLGIAELIASGTSSFSDMYMHLPGIVRAVEESGIKANLAYGTTSFGQDLELEATNGFDEINFLLDYRHQHPDSLITPELALHAEYTSTPRTAQSLADFARRHQLRVQIHLSETQKEHEECKERHQGQTPLAYFHALGLTDLPLNLAHCVWLEAGDYRILEELAEQKRDISLIHNPSSNLKLASGFADLKKWQATGVNIAIGTDGASSNNNLDMLEEINLASLLAKAVSRDAEFMDPTLTFKLASRGGSLAQGHAERGLIKEDYAADLAVFDLDDLATTPCYDPAANLLYAANRNRLYLNMVAGKVLYRDGQFLTIDIEKVKHQVRRISEAKVKTLRK